MRRIHRARAVFFLRTPVVHQAACLFLALFLGEPLGLSGQEGSDLTGRILDSHRHEPARGALVQLRGTGHYAFTDSQGLVFLKDVKPGTYVIEVIHLNVEHLDSLHVPASGDLDFNLVVTSDAVELEPVVVSVPAREQQTSDGRGTGVNRMTRNEIRRSRSPSDDLATILERGVTGITVSSKPTRSGAKCVEFRPKGSVRCDPPVVVVDGVRIGSPLRYLDRIPPQQIESLEVLSALDAATRYGTGTGSGAILIETRRLRAEAGDAELPPATRMRRYNWNLEPGDHPWARALGGAALGTAGGLALTLGIAGDCSPLNEVRRSECPGAKATLASTAAFVVPLAGAVLGAKLFGKTEWSEGVLGKTLMLTSVPMLSGFFFATPHEADQSESRAQEIFGQLVVAVGVPLAATVADRVFRVFRSGSGGEE